MKNELHSFHIPVMGLGYSIDTPIRVAHFGISSVISIVDDILIEKVRKHYCEKRGFPYTPIRHSDDDARAKRVTAWLDIVGKIVDENMRNIMALSFFEDNDKKKYFDLLPGDSPLRREYEDFLRMPDGPERNEIGEVLTRRMKPGSIDVNIMVKVDKANYDSEDNQLGDEFNDAKAALRGFANSRFGSALVFSAGINKGLFSYMTRFPDFYRDETGVCRKKIILKVSDFRSALIQGRFLAKKGLEVHEYRIESGLNCGGHAFATNGLLLPGVMREFKENREQLATGFKSAVQKYYSDREWPYPEAAMSEGPLVTVQGGIGCFGENRRLMEDFGMDMTGWASPFLLVPEATCVDDSTRRLLEQAGNRELFLSNVSPYGIPFNNVRNSGSEKWTLKMAENGKPGSPCPRRFLVSNTEFSERPICTGSRQYQKLKLAQLDDADISNSEKESRRKEITAKSCLCDHLGNSALIALGLAEEKNAPQIVCPGPNIEWFTKPCSLKEMVNHIYGRGESLVPSHRPHMFANEMKMYVDYFEKQVKNFNGTEREFKTLREFKDNLRAGMAFCLEIAEKQPYPGENLASLKTMVEMEGNRLKSAYRRLEKAWPANDATQEGSTAPIGLSAAACS